jgi:hypothetical protein
VLNLLTRGTLSASMLVVLIAVGAIVLSACGGAGNGGVHPRRTAGVIVPPDASRPSGRHRLAATVDRAQAAIDDPLSTGGELASAALVEQLAARRLAGEARFQRRATLALLAPRARSATSANLAAAAALSAVATRPRSLPRWRIVQPPAPDTLRGYFQRAQARFGVRWQYLAAIEFIETRFGRIDGLSTAGAQGPMQFLPSTWARYGSGNIRDPRDAILSAAHFLVANGAPRHMPAALYAYNNSVGYVRAVQDYAGFMRRDPRAYYGYYYWRVIYDRASGAVILPLGYPKTRPVPLSSQ